MSNSKLNSSNSQKGINVPTKICIINTKLIAEVTGLSSSDFHKIQILDLHLKDELKGKIRKIENIGMLIPNITQLNLSYNVIVKMEGLSRLHHLVELNLAENAIRNIENIESLHALERLNLSGNQIQRIPEAISSLQRLTHLRIARNELDIVQDLQLLNKCLNLAKLSIDENPICKLEYTRYFAIFNLKSLVYLDGYAVTNDEREYSRARFASNDIMNLRSKLSQELHTLAALKNDIGRSPERRLATRSMELSRYGGNKFEENQLEVNQAHVVLGQKLQSITTVEANIQQLKQQIEFFSSNNNNISQNNVNTTTATTKSLDVNRNSRISSSPNRGRYSSEYGSPVPFLGEVPPTNSVYLGEFRRYLEDDEDEVCVDNNNTRTPTTSFTPSSPIHNMIVARASADRVHSNTSSSDTYRTTSNNTATAAKAGGGDRIGSSSGGVAANTPVVSDTATKQITQLTDRIEKLASRLLQVDKEKTSLQHQLNAEKTKQQTSNSITDLNMSTLAQEVLHLREKVQETNDLFMKSEQENISLKETIHVQENELAKAKIEVTKHSLFKENNKSEFDVISNENKNLKREISELRKTIVQSEEVLSENVFRSRYTSASGQVTAAGTSLEQWKAHEARLDIAGKRVEIEELLRVNEKLQREVEVLLFEVTSANEACLHATTEAEHYRDKARLSDESNKNNVIRITELERELFRKNRDFTESEYARKSMEEEKLNLQAAFNMLKQDMATYLLAKDNTPRKQTYHQSSSFTLGGNLGDVGTSTHNHRLVTANNNPGTFFDAPSTDDSDTSITKTEKTHHQQQQQSSGRTKDKTKRNTPSKQQRQLHKKSIVATFGVKNTTTDNPHALELRFGVTQLELAAAEIMAHTFLQEIEASGGNNNVTNKTATSPSHHNNKGGSSSGVGVNTPGITSGRSKSDFKEACIRAALRVVHSSVQMHQKELDTIDTPASDDLNETQSSAEGISESKHNERDRGTKLHPEIEIMPFHALGSREFLAKLVADTYAGMTAIEDSDLLKLEIKQLEQIIHEQEVKVKSLDNLILIKSQESDSIHKHCSDSKKLAEQTLNELDFLTSRLQDGRDHIAKTEAELALAKRELELIRHSLQESIAMSDIEHQNIHSTRSRIVELKQEQSLYEQQILQSKEQIIKEEEKLRTTKSLATDQLRFLQMDLNKIQSDFKVKARNIEDLEKQRRSIEEEIEIKQRDSDNQLVATSREYEEEARKLNNTKCELRVQNLEVDQLISKRRQLESEINRVQELLGTESNKYDALQLESKRKLELLERQVHISEKKIRENKEKVSAYEAEQVLLRHGVEELRRQQSDLERASELRRRTMEEELSRTQHQAQVSVRAFRQAEGQAEQKQAEVDTVVVELRAVERRLEDTKRQVRDQEMALDSQKDAMKGLDLDRERIFKDSALIRKEEDELRHQSQIIRTSIDHDSRAYEDIKRRLNTIKEEEVALKDSEIKLRTLLAQSSKALEDGQIELESIRSSSEREKRKLAEIRTQRITMESDMVHLQDEYNFAKERVNQENIVRMESEAVMLRCREETSRSQKILGSVEKRIEDALRREEDLRRNEVILKANLDKLRSDAENFNSIQLSERTSVNTSRDELRDLNSEIKRSKDTLRIVELDIQNNQISLETIKTQYKHLEGLKDDLNVELNRIRETNRIELRRTEQLDKTYIEVEQRLKTLREELTSTEDSYERIKNQNVEEQGRVHGQRRILRQTMEELSKAENAVSETYRQMYEERQRALLEIGQLGQAKQSAHAHMFLTKETQKKLEQQQNSSSSIGTTSNINNTNNLNNLRDSVDYVGNLNTPLTTIPDHLTSQVSSTIYKAIPSLATTGVKYNSKVLQQEVPLSRQSGSSSGYADTLTTYNNIAYQQDHWKSKEYKTTTNSSNNTSSSAINNPFTSINNYNMNNTVHDNISNNTVTNYLPSTSRYNNRIPMMMMSTTNIPSPPIKESTNVSNTLHMNSTDNTHPTQNTATTTSTVELGTLQREVEKLKHQSAAILSEHI